MDNYWAIASVESLGSLVGAFFGALGAILVASMGRSRETHRNLVAHLNRMIVDLSTRRAFNMNIQRQGRGTDDADRQRTISSVVLARDRISEATAHSHHRPEVVDVLIAMVGSCNQHLEAQEGAPDTYRAGLIELSERLRRSLDELRQLNKLSSIRPDNPGERAQPKLASDRVQAQEVIDALASTGLE